MKNKLTKRVVDAIPVPSRAEGDRVVRDTELVGFGLRVTPSGSRIYFAEPRLGGRRRRVRIGRHGSITADQAREKAKQILAHTILGEHVAEARQQQRALPTVADLLDAYAARFAKFHKKPRTVAEDERMTRLHLLPALGSKKAAELRGEDIESLRRAMERTPIRFNACRALLSHAFNLALRGQHGPLGAGWGVTANPCTYIPKYPTKRRERFLSPGEFTGTYRTLIDTWDRALKFPTLRNRCKRRPQRFL